MYPFPVSKWPRLHISNSSTATYNLDIVPSRTTFTTPPISTWPKPIKAGGTCPKCGLIADDKKGWRPIKFNRKRVEVCPRCWQADMKFQVARRDCLNTKIKVIEYRERR